WFPLLIWWTPLCLIRQILTRRFRLYAYLEPLSAKYKNIAGVEEKLTYTDTYAQENVTIDMEKVDFKALQGISGINVSAEDAKKGITMAQMELVMKAAGFKEVK
ncbi:YehR family protein, partial [Shigella boydii]